MLQFPGHQCNATYQCGYNSLCDYSTLTCNCATGYYLNSSNYCSILNTEF
jgi:hypothetical protein